LKTSECIGLPIPEKHQSKLKNFLTKNSKTEDTINIYDFADIIGAQLRVVRYSNQNGRWSAQFEHCEIKSGSILCGAHGNGTTPYDAIEDYIKEIQGKILVLHAYSPEYRRQYNVPNVLTQD
jgi:hypothetical protein